MEIKVITATVYSLIKCYGSHFQDSQQRVRIEKLYWIFTEQAVTGEEKKLTALFLIEPE